MFWCDRTRAIIMHAVMSPLLDNLILLSIYVARELTYQPQHAVRTIHVLYIYSLACIPRQACNGISFIGDLAAMDMGMDLNSHV